MTLIDVTKTPKHIPLFFDRSEGTQRGGWTCKTCGRFFADTIPFGPPDPHECPRFFCSWCPRDPSEPPGASHGICPRHFEEALNA